MSDLLHIPSPAGGVPLKPRLLAIGLAAHGTGLTRVLRRILSAIEDDFEIHYIGLARDGEPYSDGTWRVYPTGITGPDVYGAYLARDLVEKLGPAVVFIHHDIWHFPRYLELLEPVRGNSLLVGYVPIDGDVTNESLAAPLASLNMAVLYTEFARRQIEQAFDKLGLHARLEIIGHGVDTVTFVPAAALLANGFDSRYRVQAKREFFPALDDPESSFVVLNASRPANRKRIDITLAGFAEFAKDKPSNVKLCLHQAISREQESKGVLEMAAGLGIADRLLFNSTAHLDGPVTDERLNLLYNACDVGLNTCMGEGWGLVSFEHAAAGGAQVLPRHTALTE